MEIVTHDSLEIVSQRAYEAVRKIGRVIEFDPSRFVEGKVYVNGYPALLTVEWKMHRDGERVRVDISATSNDELSRAADSTLYRFAEAFKSIQADDLILLPRQRAVRRAIMTGVLLGILVVALTGAFFLGYLPPR